VTVQADDDRRITHNIAAIVEYLKADFRNTEIQARPDDQPLMHAFVVRLPEAGELTLRVRVALLADKDNNPSYIRGLLARADVATQLRQHKIWDL
jgi:hypothetical protein